ncbi:MAG: hypothetical protein ACRD50_03475 [Candidatus Acidiferrales bacterium]
MTRTFVRAIAILALVCFAPALRAQERSAANSANELNSLKVQIVLSEYDGNKKISSLPYTMLLTSDKDRSTRNASLRMGVRVPVSSISKDSQYTYEDVGTDLDAVAQNTEDGRFKIWIAVARSSLYSPNEANKVVEWSPGSRPPSTLPLIRSFRFGSELLMRDGQTAEINSSTDPIDGHVLKVEVTLSVLK